MNGEVSKCYGESKERDRVHWTLGKTGYEWDQEPQWDRKSWGFPRNVGHG